MVKINSISHLKKPSPLKMPTPNTRPTVIETCDPIDAFCRPVFVLEKHMSVIRKGPTMPLTLDIFKYTIERADLQGVLGDDIAVLEDTFTGDLMPQSSNWTNDISSAPVSQLPNTKGTASDGSDISIFYNQDKDPKVKGDTVLIPIDVVSAGFDIQNGDKLEIEYSWIDTLGVELKATYTLKVTHVGPGATPSLSLTPKDFLTAPINHPAPGYFFSGVTPLFAHFIKTEIVGFSGSPPPIYAITVADIYKVGLVQEKQMFQFKFPKFSYRYKYEDGEYSVFAPWSELAFIPNEFDYVSNKGYNLGMVNQIRSIKLMNWRPKNIPKDVVEIEILYKESNSPNIYTVESFTKDDLEWNAESSIDTINTSHFGEYTVTSELIHKVVESNQLLRPWDNVPRKALSQEITANRLIYANYLEGYDVKEDPFSSTLIKPTFAPIIETLDFSEEGANPDPKQPSKSLKSLRSYQLGVVYRDRYGRETPVLTSQSGSFKVEAEQARLQNKLSVELTSNPPYWAESYTFYIKETANEYYNLAMDRWYDADDGGVWLSFPSSERNKIMTGDEDSGQGSTRSSFLILKKQHDSNIPTNSGSTYKIVAVENNAPEFIKTSNQYWGSVPMMLPPAGWGINGKVGDWNSGMFLTTGLPLPNRLYIDIYAEYWDQSVLSALTTSNDAEIRIVQSAGQASAYTSQTATENNKSNWYEVSSIVYIGTPQETFTEEVTDPNTGATSSYEVEFPGQPEQIVRITLKKTFGSDTNFCVPDVDSNLALSRGLSIEARTKVIKNRGEFAGRFFVKIHRDSSIEEHIVQPQLIGTDTPQVLLSKDVKYICMAHPGDQDWKAKVNPFDPTVDTWVESNPLLGTPNLPPAGKFALIGGSGAPFAEPFDDPFNPIPEAIEVSSLSPAHANKGAFYISDGVEAGPPLMGNYWPWGPGNDSDGIFNTGWWNVTYQDYLDTGSFKRFLPHSPTGMHDWPAHPIPDWVPFSCNVCDFGASTVTENSVGKQNVAGTVPPNTLTGRYSYLNSNPSSFPGGASSLSGIVNISDGLTNTPYNAGKWNGDGYTSGANPYQYPAIWGDSSDLIDSRFDDTGGPTNAIPVWDSGTISKLREDWYYLYYGYQKVDESWPRGSFAPERWFIDKCGAANGYSGNGIWNDTNVSYMDISYYGIGKVSKHHRAFDLVDYQESEMPFAAAMGTVGTQFRFKQDPDQIVYTITATEFHNVLNYETHHGSWGTADANNTGPNPSCSGGGALGHSLCPPFGNKNPNKPNGIAGKKAFISDLFASNPELNGSAPYNYRIRFTLTLDKIIGEEGASNFHPILNHVDADGIANVKGGPKEYHDGISSHITAKKGGTTPGLKFFNLAAYWNTAVQPTGHQPDTKDANDTNNTYIGLHERGLNDTTIEIVTDYRGEEDIKPMSSNPAIWETEPMEDVGLDIYYAASPTYPIQLERHRSDENAPDPTDFHEDGSVSGAHEYDYSYRGEEIIPKGAMVHLSNSSGTLQAKVCGVQGDLIYLDSHIVEDSSTPPVPILPTTGDPVTFTWNGNGYYYGVKNDINYFKTIITDALDINVIRVDKNTHDKRRSLAYFNCYSFSNGVESNRVRDDYNAVVIDKGVKASMPLAEQYQEERKESGLIFSGIYNSTSGINRTNQFIQAEPITKDLNPINGGIMKLYARDTDLVTFCENKVFKILAKKDALFNADGNTNVTSNANVLGQTIPFTGEYGISKNPESFAAESYRIYFADKTRGAIIRLSKDGLTPISDYGMKDWFRDNLKHAKSIVGSYDTREDQYNITIDTMDDNEIEKAYTLSFVERARGWVSFKGFLKQDGISHNNIYYTFPSNYYSLQTNKDPWGVIYEVEDSRRAEVWQHGLDRNIKRIVSTTVNNVSTMSVGSGPNNLVEGMTITGNGVPIDTNVDIMNNSTSPAQMQLDKTIGYVNSGEEVTFRTPRNRFYDIKHYSMVKVLYNGDQNQTVKRFKTLDYEGTQARVKSSALGNPILQLHDGVALTDTTNYNEEYYDNYPKTGWYAYKLKTDMQDGSVKEFIEKENKWFNYIKGKADAGEGDHLDTAEFSLQGLGDLETII